MKIDLSLILILGFLINFVDCQTQDENDIISFPPVDSTPEPAENPPESPPPTEEPPTELNTEPTIEPTTLPVETTTTIIITTTETENVDPSIEDQIMNKITDFNYYVPGLLLIGLVSILTLYTLTRRQHSPIIKPLKSVVSISSKTSSPPKVSNIGSNIVANKSSKVKLTEKSSKVNVASKISTTNIPQILPSIKLSSEFATIKQDPKGKVIPLPVSGKRDSPSIDSIVSISSSQGIELRSDSVALRSSKISKPKSKIKKVTFSTISSRSSPTRKRSPKKKKKKKTPNSTR